MSAPYCLHCGVSPLIMNDACAKDIIFDCMCINSLIIFFGNQKEQQNDNEGQNIGKATNRFNSAGASA